MGVRGLEEGGWREELRWFEGWTFVWYSSSMCAFLTLAFLPFESHLRCAIQDEEFQGFTEMRSPNLGLRLCGAPLKCV